MYCIIVILQNTRWETNKMQYNSNICGAAINAHCCDIIPLPVLYTIDIAREYAMVAKRELSSLKAQEVQRDLLDSLYVVK